MHGMSRDAGLSILPKKLKHRPGTGHPLPAPKAANEEWWLNFAHDVVTGGQAIRVFSVVDAYSQECLALEVATSFATQGVMRVLDQVISECGQPLAIRRDPRPELTSRRFLAWCVERQIGLRKSGPNGHLESFQGRLRDECLAVNWFQDLFDARRKIAAWRIEYNEKYVYGSWGYETPKEFAAEVEQFYRTDEASVKRRPSPVVHARSAPSDFVVSSKRQIGTRIRNEEEDGK
jgi:putative transposase